MTKYERLKRELAENGFGKMKCFGHSMKPILASGCLNEYRSQDEYQVGDIVFCKVKGNYIDAHKITKKSTDGKYLISNNHNHDNGWTRTIYGKVVSTTTPSGSTTYF